MVSNLLLLIDIDEFPRGVMDHQEKQMVTMPHSQGVTGASLEEDMWGRAPEDRALRGLTLLLYLHWLIPLK